MSKSKHYITFTNKMLHFDADLELVSILSDSYARQCKDLTTLFPDSNNNKYKTLSSQKVCTQNRNIAIGHLANTVYSSYIKDLYEELSIYLHSVVKEAYAEAKVDPKRLVGSQAASSMKYGDILTLLQQGTLADEIIDNIFQSLESEQSDSKLIKQIKDRLGIEIESEIVANAVLYMDIRHKLVHSDAYVDNKWKASHVFLTYRKDKKRTYFVLDYKVVSDAKSSIIKLVDAIDHAAISKGLIKENTPKNK